MKKLLTIGGGALLAATVLLIPTQAALVDGLVSHWSLDSVQDGIAPDGTGNNPMTVVGPGEIQIVPGQRGNAFVFNGTHYLINRHSTDNAATGLPLYKAGASYSITMWVNGPATTAKYLFTHGNTNNTTPLFILQTGQAAGNGAKFDVIIRPDSGAAPVNHRISATDVFDETWHHVAWVDEGGQVSLYIDGVLDTANFNYTPAGTYTFNDTVIGNLVRTGVTATPNYTGMMDDIGLWKRALSAEEVQEVIQNGVPAVVVVTPPSFVSEPADVTKQVGDWVIFAVDVAGTRPLSYQWHKNGEPIPDAINQSLFVSGLTTANSGEEYHVVVSNSASTITSRKAKLTVLADPAADLPRGLVNYWPLNSIENSNGLLTSEDLASGNDMVLVGFADQTDVVPGKFGNGLAFDLATKYTYRTNGAPIYARSNYTVSMWVKGNYTDGFSDQVDRRVFSEGSTANNNPLFTLGTDNVTANMSASATVFIRSDTAVNSEVVGKRSTRPVFNDEWNHLVWTDASGTGKLYINGVLDETDFTYTRPTLTLNTTSLGAVVRAAVGNFFFGSIDEVATWDRVLTWTEIQQVMSSGVPEPAGAIPASIVVQPISRTTGVFTGDSVRFTVQAGGTEPISFQWRKNGEPISTATNPSAQTATLELNNVQAGDAGMYSVVVSNTGATVTSQDAELMVTPYGPGEVLKIDVGLTGSSNPQPGFPEFNIGVNGRTYNGVKVTFTPTAGAVLAERNRTTGAMVVNIPPELTQAQIYNDFIFANSTADGEGLEVLIEGLQPNKEYELTLWSFDPQSTGDRFADWNEMSSGIAVPIQLGYTFNGSILPAADEDRTVKATVTSSSQGTLQLQGVKAGGTSFGVFVNAIRLALPAPPQGDLKIVSSELVNGKIRFTIQKQTAAQQISIQQRPDVAAGEWTPATGGGIISTDGTTAVAEFSATGSQMFYRVAATP